MVFSDTSKKATGPREPDIRRPVTIKKEATSPSLQVFPRWLRQCIDSMELIGAFENQLRSDFIRLH
jgi:hypothetical protein